MLSIFLFVKLISVFAVNTVAFEETYSRNFITWVLIFESMLLLSFFVARKAVRKSALEYEPIEQLNQ